MNESSSTDRVLLVDDNPTNLSVLYEALQEEGYELLVAQSGEEAIEIARAADPAVILLDINMPGISGYETCEQLKADPATRDSVVIYLSARGDVQDKVRGFDTGAVDYISKPFSFEEVIARVRTHLGTFHQRRNLEEQLALRLPELGAPELATLIAKGEGESLEFKSTLRTNLHTGKPDKRMENACLKTIAAYLNSAGGTLLIGVADDGSVLGLANDAFPNADKFLLHLNALVANFLGGDVSQFLKSSVHDYDEGEVASVQCLPSPNPVFFRRDSTEYFYVRSGPSTRHLSPSEVLSYLDGRKTTS